MQVPQVTNDADIEPIDSVHVPDAVAPKEISSPAAEQPAAVASIQHSEPILQFEPPAIVEVPAEEETEELVADESKTEVSSLSQLSLCDH